MKIPRDALAGVDIRFAFDVGASSVTETLRAVRLMRLMHQPGGGIQLLLDGHPLCSMARNGELGLEPAGLEDLERLVSDLDVLERHSMQEFGVPASTTNLELARIRAATLLLASRYVVHPDVRTFTATLNGKDEPSLRQLLEQKAGAFVLDMPTMAIDILGQQVVLGHVRLYHPQAEVVNAEELMVLLDKGLAQAQSMKLRPASGQHFYAFMPDRFPPWITEPQLSRWEISGFCEPGIDAVTAPAAATYLPTSGEVGSGAVLVASPSDVRPAFE